MEGAKPAENQNHAHQNDIEVVRIKKGPENEMKGASIVFAQSQDLSVVLALVPRLKVSHA